MLQGDLRAFVRQLSKEKGLEVEIVKMAIEEAIVQASKKNLSLHKDARCTLDMETGDLKLKVKKEVVDWVKNERMEITLKDAKKLNKDAEIGDDVEVEIPPANFGRIAAQSARQHVMQALRDAERLKVVAAYGDRVGELVTGEVARKERRDIVIKLAGGGEGALPFNETPYPNRHRPGDRIKVIISGVDPEARGPLVRLSRSHPQLIAKLFEQEVPEISGGTVEVLGVAREPGIRSKIAVHSKNSDVDPVGACVGLKGSRVQMVVGELDGERVDIVEYKADAREFIKNALNPAEIVSVSVNDEEKEADVLVARGNLSLAIGRRGQNARLAAKLTGWKIDIRSEEEASDKALELAQAEIERRYLEDFLQQIENLTDLHITAFGKQEFNSVQKISDAPLDRLTRTLSGDEELAKAVQAGAKEYAEALKEMQAVTAAEMAAAAAEIAAAEEAAKAEAGETAEGGTDEEAADEAATDAEANTSEDATTEAALEDESAATDAEPVAEEKPAEEKVEESEASEAESPVEESAEEEAEKAGADPS